MKHPMEVPLLLSFPVKDGEASHNLFFSGQCQGMFIITGIILHRTDLDSETSRSSQINPQTTVKGYEYLINDDLRCFWTFC